MSEDPHIFRRRVVYNLQKSLVQCVGRYLLQSMSHTAIYVTYCNLCQINPTHHSRLRHTLCRLTHIMSRSIQQNRLKKSRHASRSIKKRRQEDVSLDGVDVSTRQDMRACVNDFKHAYVNRCKTCVWHHLRVSQVFHRPRHPCLRCLS